MTSPAEGPEHRTSLLHKAETGELASQGRNVHARGQHTPASMATSQSPICCCLLLQNCDQLEPQLGKTVKKGIPGPWPERTVATHMAGAPVDEAAFSHSRHIAALAVGRCAAAGCKIDLLFILAVNYPSRLRPSTGLSFLAPALQPLFGTTVSSGPLFFAPFPLLLFGITVTHILLIVSTLTVNHPSGLGPSDGLFSCAPALLPPFGMMVDACSPDSPIADRGPSLRDSGLAPAQFALPICCSRSSASVPAGQ